MHETEHNTISALRDREEELGLLRRRLYEAGAGEGRVALLRGPPGIGKSALLASTRALAEQEGFSVLGARGAELEREFSCGLVRQLFEPELRRLSTIERREVMSGAAALAERALEVAGPDPEAGEHSELLTTLHGLYWLIANLAERQPVMLAVDDAHWGDLVSLRWLCYLAHRLDGVPLLAVVACRPGSPGPTASLLEELGREDVSSVIVPSPLTEGGVRRLIEDAFEGPSDDAFVSACHVQSGGNPLLVRELVKALISEGERPDARVARRVMALPPEAALRAVQTRLAHLPKSAARLARAIALLETEVGLHDAAALAGLDERVAAGAADALSAVGILEPGLPLQFVHPLVRAAVYDEIPLARRARDHARAASLLRDDPAADERVTGHLLACERLGEAWVIEHLRHAARRALARGAPETAIMYLERCLAERPGRDLRSHVLRELGVAEARVSPPSAIAHLEAALETTVEPRERVAISRELASAMGISGRVGEAYEILDEALEEVPPGDRELLLQMEAELLAAGMVGPCLAHAASKRVASIQPLRGETPGERLLLAHIARHRQLTGAPAQETRRLAARALARGRLLHEQPPDSAAYVLAVSALWHSGAHEAAERLLEPLLEEVRARGSVSGSGLAGALQSPLSFHRGELSAAESQAHSTLEFGRQAGSLVARTIGAATCVLVAIERGALDDADRILSENDFAGPLSDTFVLLNYVLYARGCLQIAQGKVDRGIADLLELGRREHATGHNCALYLWRASVAPALAAAGEPAEGRRLAEEELGMAHRRGTAGPKAAALRALASVEGGSAGLRHLRQAVTILEPTPFRLEHARSLTELGAALRRANHRSESREPLRRGLDIAQRCGASALAEKARHELLATGARPRRIMLTGADSLTATERRVAELAVDGLTNKQIAQALFVTIRTVTTHLTHTYAKLGINSRTELDASLTSSGARIAAGKPTPA